MTKTRVLLKLPLGLDPGSDAISLIEIARLAEGAGFYGVALSDHVVMGNQLEAYTWSEFPFPPSAPWVEPLTVLSAMGATTSTLRLATAILIAPLRPAALLAKMVATADVLSSGRLDLGVGTGWQREEFEAQGMDFDRRGQALTDTVAACRRLWTTTPATFDSPTVRFTDIYCEPKPVQAGGPPILFSGTLTQRNVDRIVTIGDGWIPIMGASPRDIDAGVDRLAGALRTAGREPSSLKVRVPLPPTPSEAPTLQDTLATIGTLRTAGATEFVLPYAALVRQASSVSAWFEDAAEALRSVGA